MELAGLHVAAACAALALGAAILVGRKGVRRHVVLGRLYVAVMVAVNVPVLFVYDTTGRPGPFHVLAVVSLATTGLGWRSARRAASVRAHAAFMTWSWVGVVTAGLAQLANRELPEQAPLPVLGVVALTTGLGLLVVRRFADSQTDRLRARPTLQATGGLGPEDTRRLGAGCC